MAELRRGDTIHATITLTDTDTEGPLDLSGKMVRVTCKEQIDGAIVYQHSITVNGAGVVTQANGLALVGPATDGVLLQTWTSTETSQFRLSRPPGKPFPFDIEVRAIGNPDIVDTALTGEDVIIGDVTLPPV